MKTRTILRNGFFLTVSSVFSASVFAGRPSAGSITFAPVEPAAIPTMGGIGLVLLAVIVGFLAIQALRNRQAGQHLTSIMALGLCALISAAAGVNLISESRALIPDKEITNPEGQTLPIEFGNPNVYRNKSGVAMQVVEIVEPSECGAIAMELDQQLCETGLIIEDTETCRYPCALVVLPSDQRLKTDIVKTGMAANGLALYQFRYIGDSVLYQGVMAQDVLEHTPSAVAYTADGYMAVDYQALGLEMTRVD